MAFCWRANNGPTLNAGLVPLKILGIRSSIAKKFYIFVFLWFFRGGGGGGVDPLFPPSGSAHGTGKCIYWKSILWCPSACILSIACTHFLIDEIFFFEFHWSLIWIQTVYANVKRERERERLVHAIPFGKNQSASADRQVEREMCNFVIFFNSENSSTYFKVSRRSLQKNLIVRDVLQRLYYNINWKSK